MTNRTSTITQMAQKSRLSIEVDQRVLLAAAGVAGAETVLRGKRVNVRELVIEAMIAHWGGKYSSFAEALEKEL